jgi:hypothetical protein
MDFEVRRVSDRLPPKTEALVLNFREFLAERGAKFSLAGRVLCYKRGRNGSSSGTGRGFGGMRAPSSWPGFGLRGASAIAALLALAGGIAAG